MNQYSQRTVPAYAEISGSANPAAVLSFQNLATGDRIRAGRNQEWFHAFMPLSDNSAASVSNEVRMIGVLPGAGTNGVDLINTNQTLTLAAMKTPEVFTYDDDGNLLSDGRISYNWNAENRLVAVSNSTALVASYKYDHQGLMVSRTLNASTTIYLWDGWNVIFETSPTLTNSYVWGLDLSGTLQDAGGVGGLVAANLNGTNVFYCTDGNGNVSDLIDNAGTVVAHYEYDSFGNEIVSQQSALGNATNPWRFSSKYLEAETGLLHYELRPYSPSLGKWLSRDPIGERGGANLYGFVQNNAINAVDALGHYTLNDAWSSLINQSVTPAIPGYWDPTTSTYIPGQYSAQQLFDKWLELEENDSCWLKNIPDCPDKICMSGDKPVNCNNGQWGELKNDRFVKKFHPGADYCMRSRAFNGSAQQCCYRKSRDASYLELIKLGTAAGTPDREAAGETVGTIFNFITGTGHFGHDVSTFNLADDLNRISDYLKVRPPSKGGGRCYE